MLDIKRLREDFDNVKAAVERRCKGDFGIDNVMVFDEKRRSLLAEVEQMKNLQKIESKKIPQMKISKISSTISNARAFPQI